MRPRILRHCEFVLVFLLRLLRDSLVELASPQAKQLSICNLERSKKKGNLRPETSNLVIWQTKCYPRPGLQRGPVETCPAGAHLRLGQTGSAKCMAKPTVVSAAVMLVMFYSKSQYWQHCRNCQNIHHDVNFSFVCI